MNEPKDSPSVRRRDVRRRDYAPVAASVRQARADIASYLSGRRIRPGMADDALLVLSELVANAVRHGRLPRHRSLVRVEVRAARDTVQVGVSDTNPSPPAPATASDEDEGHRGLLIVQRLAIRWGVRPRPAIGKTVWALVAAQ
jgi:anti-sigma regulatory factor (Ser/Thr protein kinase)